MADRYYPELKILPTDQMEQLRREYGEIDVFDVSYLVMSSSNVDHHIRAPCGCEIGRRASHLITRAQQVYQEDRKTGERALAVLGSLWRSNSGGIAALRMADGGVVVYISSRVADTDPMMEIKGGMVTIRSDRGIPNGVSSLGGRSLLLRAADAVKGKRSHRFGLVEGTSGGHTLTVNTLRLYDYSLVHPVRYCSRKASSAVKRSSPQGRSARKEKRSGGSDAHWVTDHE
jgi:hypothetical protein